MAAVAKIKFSQGATIGTAGWALFGDLGVEVTVANDNATDVKTYTFELLSAPVGSSITTGIKQDGGASTFKFTPDVRGGYLFRLIVKDAAGQASIHVLCFGVKETNGKFLPPVGAKASALNFDGQARGWAKYIEEWLVAAAIAAGTPAIPKAKESLAVPDDVTGLVLSAAQAANGLLTTTGVLTAQRPVVYPDVVDADAHIRLIRNTCSDAIEVKTATGVETFVIGAGLSHLIAFDADGARNAVTGV